MGHSLHRRRTEQEDYPTAWARREDWRDRRADRKRRLGQKLGVLADRDLTAAPAN